MIEKSSKLCDLKPDDVGCWCVQAHDPAQLAIPRIHGAALLVVVLARVVVPGRDLALAPEM